MRKVLIKLMTLGFADKDVLEIHLPLLNCIEQEVKEKRRKCLQSINQQLNKKENQ